MQSDSLHAGVMRQVDDARYVLKIHIGIAAHEGDLLDAGQVDSRETRFQLLPCNIFLIQLHGRGLILATPDTWITIVRGCGWVGLLLVRLRDLRLFPYSGSMETTSMNMMISVSSTSISGVTLICGPDGPLPGIEKAMGIAPLGHACLQHQTPRVRGVPQRRSERMIACSRHSEGTISCCC